MANTRQSRRIVVKLLRNMAEDVSADDIKKVAEIFLRNKRDKRLTRAIKRVIKIAETNEV